MDIWNYFYDTFSFNPSPNPEHWPSIKSNRVNLKIDIKNLWGDTYNETVFDDFEEKAIQAFTSINNDEEYVYVLDWQHDCYFVNMNRINEFKNDLISKYNHSISFIPDGDYYIFITKNLENIWFGHPWEKTVTLFGDKLINAFKESAPIFLRK